MSATSSCVCTQTLSSSLTLQLKREEADGRKRWYVSPLNEQHEQLSDQRSQKKQSGKKMVL